MAALRTSVRPSTSHPGTPAARHRPARLRILHLAFDDPRRPRSGVAAVRNHEINRRLARRHDVTAVTVTYRGARKRDEDGVHYVPVGLPLGHYGAILTYFAVLPLVVWTRTYDLLVEDFAPPFGSALAPLWARGAVVAQVQWLQAVEKSRQYHLPFFLVERWGARAHQVCIAASGGVAARLREMGTGREVVVLPDGLESGVRRAERGSRQDALFLGQLDLKASGLDLLLPAFAAIAERSPVDLVIAGDGPDRQRLVDLVHRLGLQQRVRLVGPIDGSDRFDLLATAQLVCLPTRDGPSGQVAVEALACGVPVLSFDKPDSRVAPASVLVPAFDVDAYANALATLGADPERCRKLGVRSLRRNRHVLWGRIARSQEQVYKRAAAARRRRGVWNVPSFARCTGAILRSPAGLARALGLRGPAAQVSPVSGLTPVLQRAAAPVAVALAAFAVRAALVGHGFEIHVDEAVYLRISQNLAWSSRLEYDLAGTHLFFLHPPFYFVIEAAYLEIFHPSGDAVHQVITVRFLAAFFGAISAAALFVLCRRLAGRWAALAAAALFALDPFIVRMDSRNFLEPAALFWVLLGLCAIIPLCGRSRSESRLHWSAPAAGAAFGAALVTNEPSALVTLLPVGLGALLGVFALRDAVMTAGCALAVYSVYPITAVLTGNLYDFRAQKLDGLNRFLGLHVTTGFNGAAGPSFLQSVAGNVQAFGPTYALLAIGIPATLWLLLQPSRTSRLVACWAGSAYALQGYAVLFGTNEEQYFYYVATMALLAVVVAMRSFFGRSPWRAGDPALAPLRTRVRPDGSSAVIRRRRSQHRLPIKLRGPLRSARAVPLVLLAAYLSVSASIAVDRFTTPDDGYRQLTAFLKANVAPGTAIAATSPTDAVLLREDGYTITDMGLVSEESRNRTRIRDPHVLLAAHPRYVIVTTRL
ncbi:MAG: glycosyltransferase family 4 protein, partial [bacterium]|nr:glycosyltransferase family 4 protein [bacterium]